MSSEHLQNKINIKNQLHFYTLTANIQKMNMYTKAIPFIIASKSKILRNIFNKKSTKLKL